MAGSDVQTTLVCVECGAESNGLARQELGIAKLLSSAARAIHDDVLGLALALSEESAPAESNGALEFDGDRLVDVRPVECGLARSSCNSGTRGT